MGKRVTKYQRYQDYVIRDGRLLGEFEQMYRDFDDPWHQSSSEQFATDKAAGVNLLARLKAHHGIRRVLEVGCGFGDYSARIANLGLVTKGIDISKTAIDKAIERHEGVEFAVGTISQYDLVREFAPDVVVLSEVTWYVLAELQGFVAFMRGQLPDAFLLHLLTTYPPGVQTYGVDFFTDLAGIKKFFGMRWLECGEVQLPGGTRTWALGTWSSTVEAAWKSAS